MSLSHAIAWRFPQAGGSLPLSSPPQPRDSAALSSPYPRGSPKPRVAMMVRITSFEPAPNVGMTAAR